MKKSGYKNPPEHTRFKTGQSGNPKGRPKGSRNLKTDLRDQLKQRMAYRENGEEKKDSKQNIMLASLMAKAMKGDIRAIQLVCNLTMKLLGDEMVEQEAAPLSQSEEAVLEDFLQRMTQGEKS